MDARGRAAARTVRAGVLGLVAFGIAACGVDPEAFSHDPVPEVHPVPVVTEPPSTELGRFIFTPKIEFGMPLLLLPIADDHVPMPPLGVALFAPFFVTGFDTHVPSLAVELVAQLPLSAMMRWLMFCAIPS